MTNHVFFGPQPVDAKDDLYYAVHKGLRLVGARVLCRLGAADAGDPAELAAALALVRAHLALGESHLRHENAEIHAALEARCPGASDHAAEDHDGHLQSFGDLAALAAEAEAASGAERARALRRLYMRFALFFAEDLRHMHEEETEVMPLIAANFTPEERAAIEGRIVASIPPETMVEFMRAILPALPSPDRSAMLEGMRAGMPPEVFGDFISAVLGVEWDGADMAAFDRLAA